MREKQIKLGSFEVVSNQVRVSDPCYNLDTWCAGTINKVKRGTWVARVIKSDEGSWGNRCAILVAHHKDHPVSFDSINFAIENIKVGVDSGQAGIFDIQHFRDDNVAKDVEKYMEEDEQICTDEPWYSLCCDRTLDGDGAGVIPFGCVSSSGFGDGSYDCFTIETNNEITAIKIEFINENEEEEIEEEEEEEEFDEEDEDDENEEDEVDEVE